MSDLFPPDELIIACQYNTQKRADCRKCRLSIIRSHRGKYCPLAQAVSDREDWKKQANELKNSLFNS